MAKIHLAYEVKGDELFLYTRIPVTEIAPKTPHADCEGGVLTWCARRKMRHQDDRTDTLGNLILHLFKGSPEHLDIEARDLDTGESSYLTYDPPKTNQPNP